MEQWFRTSQEAKLYLNKAVLLPIRYITKYTYHIKISEIYTGKMSKLYIFNLPLKRRLRNLDLRNQLNSFLKILLSFVAKWKFKLLVENTWLSYRYVFCRNRMNIQPLMIYHKMNLMSSSMPLRLHWWSKNLFKSSSLNTFWYNIVFSINLKTNFKSLP